MGWQTVDDAGEFLAAAGQYLGGERSRNTVLLTVSEQSRVNPAHYSGHPDGEPLFGWWVGRDGQVGGAFLHTPPHPLLLSAVPADVAGDLAVTLAGRQILAVNGYTEAAEAFAATWQAGTPGGEAAVQRSRMRLYRLGDLVPPEPAPDGEARVATGADQQLLTDWFTAFAAEVHDTDAGEDQTSAVRDKLSYQGIWLWEAHGRPASLAALTRQVAGSVRIGPVYTPPEFRGRGYASAVTAEASRRALKAGAEEVLLYADLDNPTSNSVYQRIGYRPVEDRVVLAFSATNY